MKNKFDLTEKQLQIVQNILQKHLPNDVAIWIFGSRATFKAKPFSDLDIALEMPNQNKVSTELINRLLDDFEESDLPWKVDIIDLNSVNENFRSIIDKEKVLFI